MESIIVPANLMISGQQYLFLFKVCSEFGTCGLADAKVSVASYSLPEVSIPDRSLYATQPLSVSTELRRYSCAPDGYSTLSTSIEGIDFIWTVKKNGIIDPDLSSVSKKRNVFKLDALTLSSHNRYELQVNVVDAVTGQSSSGRAQILVEDEPIVGQIDGPRQVNVPFNTSISLHSSVRPNNALVTRQWSCIQIKPVFAPNKCGVRLDSVLSGPSLVIAALPSQKQSGAILSISQVNVVVTGPSGEFSQSSVQINVVESIYPRITVTGVQPKYNPGTTISVTSKVRTSNNLELRWSIETGGTEENLDNLLASPNVLSVKPAPGQTEDFTFALSLKPGALIGGLKYTFTIVASSLSLASSISTPITVETNSGPSPGNFIVTPATGTEMLTSFVFYAAYFHDPETPLEYAFFTENGDGVIQLLKSKSELRSSLSPLVAGSDSQGFRRKCTVRVYDSLGAYTEKNHEVVVSRAAKNESISKARTLGAKGLESGDVDLVNQGIALGADLANSIECSRQPDCALAFRSACTSSLLVDNTCGHCISDYIGSQGPSNESCISRSSLSQSSSSSLASSLVTSVSQRKLSVGQFCLNDRVCQTSNSLSAPWEKCKRSVGSGYCYLPEKECESSCNGHGTCRSVSTYGKVELNGPCFVSSVTCSVKCFCTAGYTGSACGTTLSESLVQQKSKYELIDLLEKLMDLDDISESSLESAMKNLISLSKKSEDISIAGGLKLATILSNALTLSEGISGFISEDLFSLFGVVDAIASVLSKTDTSSLRRIIVQLSKHTAFRMTSGQNVLQAKHANSRVSIVDYVHDGRSSFDITQPKTAFEEAVAPSQQTRIYFNQKTSTSGMDMKAAVVTFDASIVNPTGLSIQSEVLFIELLSDLPSVESNYENMGIALKNNIQMNFNDSSQIGIPYASTFNGKVIRKTYCSAGGFDEFTSHCPLSNIPINHTCQGLKGEIVTTCPRPSTRFKPSCSFLLGNGRLSSTGKCTLHTYNIDETTCLCDFSTLYTLSNTNNTSQRQLTGTSSDLNSANILLAVLPKQEFETDDSEQTVWYQSFPGPFQDGVVVIVSTSMLFLVIIILFFWGCFANDLADLKKEKKVTPLDEHMKDENEAIDDAIPTIIRDHQGGSRSRAWVELRQHHRYLRLFLGKDMSMVVRGQHSIFQFVHIVTVSLMAAVVLTWTEYDSPECYEYPTEATCLADKSRLFTADPKCRWQAEPDTLGFKQGFCDFRTIQSGFRSVIMCLIFAALLSIPIQCVTEHLFYGYIYLDTYSETLKHWLRRMTHPSDFLWTESMKVGTDFHLFVTTAEMCRADTSDGNSIEKFDKLWPLAEVLDELRARGLDASQRTLDGLQVFTYNKEPLGNYTHALKYIHDLRRAKSQASLLRPELFRRMSEDEIDRRLMNQLMQDLMPSYSAACFRRKFETDSPTHFAVSGVSQIFAFLLLTSYAVISVAYLTLFARDMNQHIEVSWLVISAIWTTLDCVFIQTFLVLIREVVVPILIMRDVSETKSKILQTLEEKFRAEQRGERRNSFDIPQSSDQLKAFNPLKDGDEDLKTEDSLHFAAIFFAAPRAAMWYRDRWVSRLIGDFEKDWGTIYLSRFYEWRRRMHNIMANRDGGSNPRRRLPLPEKLKRSSQGLRQRKLFDDIAHLDTAQPVDHGFVTRLVKKFNLMVNVFIVGWVMNIWNRFIENDTHYNFGLQMLTSGTVMIFLYIIILLDYFQAFPTWLFVLITILGLLFVCSFLDFFFKKRRRVHAIHTKRLIKRLERRKEKASSTSKMILSPKGHLKEGNEKKEPLQSPEAKKEDDFQDLLDDIMSVDSSDESENATPAVFKVNETSDGVLGHVLASIDQAIDSDSDDDDLALRDHLAELKGEFSFDNFDRIIPLRNEGSAKKGTSVSNTLALIEKMTGTANQATKNRIKLNKSFVVAKKTSTLAARKEKILKSVLSAEMSSKKDDQKSEAKPNLLVDDELDTELLDEIGNLHIRKPHVGRKAMAKILLSDSDSEEGDTAMMPASWDDVESTGELHSLSSNSGEEGEYDSTGPLKVGANTKQELELTAMELQLQEREQALQQQQLRLAQERIRMEEEMALFESQRKELISGTKAFPMPASTPDRPGMMTTTSLLNSERMTTPRRALFALSDSDESDENI
jgi:hypothetical protein